jgi:hypothetical protein
MIFSNLIIKINNKNNDNENIISAIFALSVRHKIKNAPKILVRFL